MKGYLFLIHVNLIIISSSFKGHYEFPKKIYYFYLMSEKSSFEISIFKILSPMYVDTCSTNVKYIFSASTNVCTYSSSIYNLSSLYFHVSNVRIFSLLFIFWRLPKVHLSLFRSFAGSVISLVFTSPFALLYLFDPVSHSKNAHMYRCIYVVRRKHS